MSNFLTSDLTKSFNDKFRAGNLLSEAVQVKLKGKVYDGWSSVRIDRDLNAMTSSFSIGVADKWQKTKNEDWPFLPGSEVVISAGGLKKSPVIVGYIDTLDSTVTNESRTIQFAGRDRTGDLVDSSALHTSYTFNNMSLFKLAETFANKFDIKVFQDSLDSLVPIKEIVVEQPETIFNLLERYAKIQGVLLTSTPTGDLKITDRKGVVVDRLSKLKSKTASKVGAALGVGKSDLKLGQNILFANVKLDESDRFQRYIVKSQIKGNDNNNGKNSAFNVGSAPDPGVKRLRTKYVKPETSMNNDQAEKHAKWLSNVHAIGAVAVEIGVQGWTREDGTLWNINEIIDVDADLVGLDPQKLLITGVTYSQSSEGTITTLRLTRLDGYQAQPEARGEPKIGKKKKVGLTAQDFGGYEQAAKANGIPSR